ncbi:alpha-L-rhamnosidase C-terminal domain-containing protein [Streptomyces sp. NPDC020490]|uniref:alpha-L-rhamnosidase C-terminal domain-containing protein n=1 Tax=Streptomyces sp. NPDC020490 TaxID=3365078 RepID=UPI0037BBD329
MPGPATRHPGRPYVRAGPGDAPPRPPRPSRRNAECGGRRPDPRHAGAAAAPQYRTPYGVARTDRERGADGFRLTVDVPAGSTAEVHVPLLGGAARAPEEAHLLRAGDAAAAYRVGSGHWTFRSTRDAARRQG